MSFGIFLLSMVAFSIWGWCWNNIIDHYRGKTRPSAYVTIVVGLGLTLYLVVASFIYESVPHLIYAWKYPFDEVICVRSDHNYINEIDFKDYKVLHVSTYMYDPCSDRRFSEYILVKTSNKVDTTYENLLKKGE